MLPAGAVLSFGLGILSFTSAVVLPPLDATAALSLAQIAAFKPYSFFSSAAACHPNATKNWSCGAICNANPGFIPVASGGDGNSIQFWYVGYDPALNTTIVGHQGTNTSDILPILTDVDILLTPLDQTKFPGTSGLEVHSGFLGAQAKAAPDVLAAVHTTLSIYSTSSVTLVGHSLGAAISLIELIYLSLHLPSSTTFTYRGYGLPRVGNQAFASYLNAHFPDLVHVNNKEDPVPILPGRFLGFRHPQGEVHIQDSGTWYACAGEDNTSTLCSAGDVSSIFNGTTQDHSGPYDGVEMGCSVPVT